LTKLDENWDFKGILTYFLSLRKFAFEMETKYRNQRIQNILFFLTL